MGADPALPRLVLRRGAYPVGTTELDRATRHLLTVQATVAGLRVPAVVSHASAAAPHGLPLWGLALDRVHITREPPQRERRGEPPGWTWSELERPVGWLDRLG